MNLKWGTVECLAGYLNEPYQTDRVMGWARVQDYAFTMREAVRGVGLPKHVINRVLTRQVKKGTLTRRKLPMVEFASGLGGSGRYRTVQTYLYSVPGLHE